MPVGDLNAAGSIRLLPTATVTSMFGFDRSIGQRRETLRVPINDGVERSGMTEYENFPDLEDFRAVGKRLSNWGRWGDDDQRGALNLITPERLVEAAQLV